MQPSDLANSLDSIHSLNIKSGKGKRTLGGHLPPGRVNIRLVAHEEHGKPVRILDLKDMLLKVDDFLERVARIHGKYEQKAFPPPQNIVSCGAEIVLTGSVGNFNHGCFVINNAPLPIIICTTINNSSLLEEPEMVGS